MWIPYDLMGSLKAETPASSTERSKADRSVRDVLIGFFVRNPVTQTWEVDVKTDAVNQVLAVSIDGLSAEIAFYGDDAGKLNEIIYRVKAGDPLAALSAARRDVEDRLARWTLELGRGMAIAGWRVADPTHNARWRCTPFRPSALDLDLDVVASVPEELKPLVRLYQRARNASDSDWRLLNAYAVLKLWREGQAPFGPAPQRCGRTITFDMLVHSGALACTPELKDQPLTAFVDELRTLRDVVVAGLERPVAVTATDEERSRFARMASLADLLARETLLMEIARRQDADIALAS